MLLIWRKIYGHNFIEDGSELERELKVVESHCAVSHFQFTCLKNNG